MDLTEAEDIKKRWQEYTEELYKKELHDQDNHDGVITDLEPDILECEVKWALESITTNIMYYKLQNCWKTRSGYHHKKITGKIPKYLEINTLLNNSLVQEEVKRKIVNYFEFKKNIKIWGAS